MDFHLPWRKKNPQESSKPSLPPPLTKCYFKGGTSLSFSRERTLGGLGAELLMYECTGEIAKVRKEGFVIQKQSSFDLYKSRGLTARPYGSMSAAKIVRWSHSHVVTSTLDSPVTSLQPLVFHIADSPGRQNTHFPWGGAPNDTLLLS